MKITDLIIDPRSLGSKFWLVDVSPAYEYRDNRRTDTVTGYRYAVALPEKGLEKINVRIDGKQLLEPVSYTHLVRSQSPPGGKHRQAVCGPGHAVPGSDPGRQSGLD